MEEVEGRLVSSRLGEKEKWQSGIGWGDWVACWLEDGWASAEFRWLRLASVRRYRGSLSLGLFHREQVSESAAVEAFCRLADLSLGLSLARGAPLIVESTPFSHPLFFNSWTAGILSNPFTPDGSVFLMDAKLALGSEGAPVFLVEGKGNRVCFGMVLSAMISRRNESLGFSLGVTLASLASLFTERTIGATVNSSRLTGDESVVLVRCGHLWGTGCVVDRRGTVLTCAHNVNFGNLNGTKITVHFNGVTTEAELIYSAGPKSMYDIAVISIKNSTDLQPFRFAASPPVKGERVLAIGHCLLSEKSQPYTATVTAGIVANCYHLDTLLQTSCAVHAGSSGGAIIRENGELLGIIAFNIQITSTKSYCPTVNLSVPIASIISTLSKYIESCDKTHLMELEKYDKN